MKIGILITSINNFGQKGFYNSQEVGLAKALAKKFVTVEVYKLVRIDQKKRSETIKNYANTKIHFIPAKNIGINGVINIKELDESLNAIIHFSDTQLSVPTVFRWCKKNGVDYIPYIGVLKSHSTSNVARFITNLMFKRNLRVYRKCSCCVKTPDVRNELKTLGVTSTILTPVGLDTDLLKKDYEKYVPSDLKRKYGYQENDNVLLFVGRLTEEKHPVQMIEILSELNKQGNNYKLLIVGNGELRAKVTEKVKELDLQSNIKIIEQIPNKDIWELYRFADVFVNLNQQEIFGMAILEAIYYGCKVVAWEAPGPNFIIENHISGFLIHSIDDAVKKIGSCMQEQDRHMNKKRVLQMFTWNSMAESIWELLHNRG